MLLLHLWVHLKDLITLFQFDKYVRNQAADIRKNKFIFFQQLLSFQNSFFLFIQLFLVSFLVRNFFLCFSQLLPIYLYLVIDSVFILFKCMCNRNKNYQKHNVRWFLLTRLVDLFRVCSSHIISRNHYKTFLLINWQKTKNCSK